MLKAFKYRLYPTEDQEVLLNKHIGTTRFVYNLALETKISAYRGITKVDPSKVFCLTTNAYRLSELRSSRNEKLGGFAKDYSDLISVRNELLYAKRYFDLHPEWKIIDVTGRPIEEISSDILNIMSKKII